MGIKSKRVSLSLCFSGIFLGWEKRKREKEVSLKLVSHKGRDFFVNS